MEVIICLDTILVPLSLFLTTGYHAYLWHIFKDNPSLTTIGANTKRRSMWVLGIKQDNEKKGMLAVQSLRNCLLCTMLAALIAIVLNSSLAALANNSYHASNMLSNTFFGTQSSRIIVVKYGLASLFLLISFLFSSMALECLTESNFLMNVSTEFSPEYLQTMFERGFTLALVGNRALCITFPLLLWMFGPVPVALSSAAVIWVLYELDFPDNKGRIC